MKIKQRLLPHHKFQVLTWGDGGKDFVRVFRSCWKQLPLRSRRSILAHWKKAPIPFPTFELSNMWGDSEVSFAQVGWNGMKLRFSAADFAVLPDRIAQWIIAHELAHVYQKAIGRSPGGDSEFENETDADKIAEDWGFEKRPMTMLKLLTQNRKVSVEDAGKRIVEMGLA
jgi:hypothetical protein